VEPGIASELVRLLPRRRVRPDKTVTRPTGGGVYFLFKDDEVVYVGTSQEVRKRVTAPAKGSAHAFRIDFDSFAVLRIGDKVDRLRAEAIYQWCLLPKHNGMIDLAAMRRENKRIYNHG
jgi:hypothetical protein